MKSIEDYDGGNGKIKHWDGYRWLMSKELAQVQMQYLKTQKAKGVRLIAGRRLMPQVNGLDFNRDGMRTIILPQNEIKPDVFEKDQIFARPCPIMPRHGFVESRQVLSLGEAQLLLEEARREDPEAELLLCRKLTGQYSAIATHAGVTWGYGNDGVTGNTSKTVLIPTSFSTAINFNSALERYVPMYSMPVPKGQAQYIELVEDKGQINAVQLRFGPEQPTTKDYIPQTVKVSYVLRVDGWHNDLLGWEKEVKKQKRFYGDGLVIQLDQWSALSSHHAVHGIELGVPVVVSKSIDRGETLEPSVQRTPRLNKAELATLARRIIKWEREDLSTRYNLYRPENNWPSNRLSTAIAVVHSMSHWDNSPMLLEFRAFAVVAISRFIAAAVLGELRHWSRTGPGKNDYANLIPIEEARKLREIPCVTPKQGIISGDRDIVYAQVLEPNSTSALLTALHCAAKGHAHEGWYPVRQQGDGNMALETQNGIGYGGPKWADAAEKGAALAQAIRDFTRKPTKGKWAKITMAANNAVHSVHNGGPIVTKWVGQEALDAIAKAPAVGFANLFAGTLALEYAP